MSISVTHELYSFSFMVLCGCVLKLLYDLVSCLRNTLRFGSTLTFVTDIIFWIFSFVILWQSLLLSTGGRLRLYLLSATFLGGVLYYFSLGAIVCFLFEKILKFLQIIFKILLTPMRFLYKILNRVLCRVALIFIKVGRFRWVPRIRKKRPNRH